MHQCQDTRSLFLDNSEGKVGRSGPPPTDTFGRATRVSRVTPDFTILTDTFGGETPINRAVSSLLRRLSVDPDP